MKIAIARHGILLISALILFLGQLSLVYAQSNSFEAYGNRSSELSNAALGDQASGWPSFRIGIHNINLRAGLCYGRDLRSRINCHISIFNSSMADRNLQFDLVAINEGERLYCSSLGSETFAVACLAEGIRKSSKVWWYQVGEIGLIVNLDKFDVIDGPFVRELGRDYGARQRWAVGVKLRPRVQNFNKSFTFWSTHINTSETKYCWRRRQVHDLIEAMREREVPGIVAGDFNCGASDWSKDTDCEFLDNVNLSDEDNSAKLCKYTATNFIEAEGFKHIEHISQLTKQPLLGAFTRYEYLTEFGGGKCSGQSTGCSDHSASYAEISIDGCTPNCVNRECGSDGCNGVCGRCSQSSCGDRPKSECRVICSEGKCEICKPNCEKKECGPDRCGGMCGVCISDKGCTSDGKCRPVSSKPPMEPGGYQEP